MIVKLSKACQQYNVQELCDLFDHARSSYYYQSKDKPITNSTKSIIKSMKQISIETGYTYGRRRLQRQLNSGGNQLAFTAFYSAIGYTTPTQKMAELEKVA